jgi:hypothetical protein
MGLGGAVYIGIMGLGVADIGIMGLGASGGGATLRYEPADGVSPM